MSEDEDQPAQDPERDCRGKTMTIRNRTRSLWPRSRRTGRRRPGWARCSEAARMYQRSAQGEKGDEELEVEVGGGAPVAETRRRKRAVEPGGAAGHIDKADGAWRSS